jgi:triosephosphate isomerase
MPKRIFAANWKMHHDPMAATRFALKFQDISSPNPARDLWFFPPAVSLAATAEAFERRPDVSVGAQNVHWEAKGAFTGETSPVMIAGCGGKGALVGHSERRHVFGETDEESAKKVKALIAQRLVPMLCVGEKLDQRERGHTADVVRRQLKAVLSDSTPPGIPAPHRYEPVWAIGTGKVARPQDAAEGIVKSGMCCTGTGTGADPGAVRGVGKHGKRRGAAGRGRDRRVLVGGASLEAEGWAAIVAARA